MDLFYIFSREKREYDDKILKVVYSWLEQEISDEKFFSDLRKLNIEINNLIKDFYEKLHSED